MAFYSINWIMQQTSVIKAWLSEQKLTVSNELVDCWRQKKKKSKLPPIRHKKNNTVCDVIDILQRQLPIQNKITWPSFCNPCLDVFEQMLIAVTCALFFGLYVVLCKLCNKLLILRPSCLNTCSVKCILSFSFILSIVQRYLRAGFKNKLFLCFLRANYSLYHCIFSLDFVCVNTCARRTCIATTN